jgi:hypothetical protein
MFVNTTGDNVNGNHYVAAGKDSQGRSYVYDPYPRSNQPNILFQDRNAGAYNHYVDGGMGQTGTQQGSKIRVNVLTGGTLSY